MAGRKKRFPCGHVGKGRYCHRCATEAKAARETEAAKTAWAARLAAAPVALDQVPRDVAEKALGVIAALDAGRPYMDLRGKRLTNMGQREVITIPLGQHYRLIATDGDGRLRFLEVLSHEAYNTRLASGGWG